MMKAYPKKILIDTDLGDDVDDAAALIMALNSPELEITGIVTVYLDTVKRAELVLELCSKYGRHDIPVCAGFKSPLIERLNPDTPPIQYGILEEDRKSRVITDCDGADFIIQKVKENPGLTIIEIGCMTNLGLAFYREPEVHDSAGAGIGLYLARKIITMQNGYVKVESETGKGSTFHIYLPN